MEMIEVPSLFELVALMFFWSTIISFSRLLIVKKEQVGIGRKLNGRTNNFESFLTQPKPT